MVRSFVGGLELIVSLLKSSDREASIHFCSGFQLYVILLLWFHFIFQLIGCKKVFFKILMLVKILGSVICS